MTLQHSLGHLLHSRLGYPKCTITIAIALLTSSTSLRIWNIYVMSVFRSFVGPSNVESRAAPPHTHRTSARPTSIAPIASELAVTSSAAAGRSPTAPLFLLPRLVLPSSFWKLSGSSLPPCPFDVASTDVAMVAASGRQLKLHRGVRRRRRTHQYYPSLSAQ
jgi:hypothetical protein